MRTLSSSGALLPPGGYTVILIVACQITFEGVSLDDRTSNAPSTTPVVNHAQLPLGASPHPLVVKSSFVTAVARVSTTLFWKRNSMHSACEKSYTRTCEEDAEMIVLVRSVLAMRLPVNCAFSKSLWIAFALR